MAKTDEVADPVSDHEPLDVDAPPNGKFMYILVFQLATTMFIFVYSNAYVIINSCTLTLEALVLPIRGSLVCVCVR